MPTESEHTSDLRAAGDAVLKWVGIGVAVLIAALILAAFIPRTWAQFVGGFIDGSLVRGSTVGVMAGLLFTAIPLGALIGAWRSRRRRGLSIFWLVVGFVTALPNLMTLWIVLGTTNSAHAGERILDVEGPGFRAGTVFGAAIAVVVVLGLVAWVRQRDRRRSA